MFFLFFMYLVIFSKNYESQIFPNWLKLTFSITNFNKFYLSALTKIHQIHVGTPKHWDFQSFFSIWLNQMKQLDTARLTLLLIFGQVEAEKIEVKACCFIWLSQILKKLWKSQYLGVPKWIWCYLDLYQGTSVKFGKICF